MLLRSTSGKDTQEFIRISTNWNNDTKAPRLISNERSKEIDRFLERLSVADRILLERQQQQPIEVIAPDLNEPEKLMLATEYINALKPISARKPAGIS